MRFGIAKYPRYSLILFSALLSFNMKYAWPDAYFLKEHGNKPVHHLIEYGEYPLYDEIFVQRFDSHFIIQDGLIEPVGEFLGWVYVMLNPGRWICRNDWEFHAMILIGYD